jgi:hypothetical protein
MQETRAGHIAARSDLRPGVWHPPLASRSGPRSGPGVGSPALTFLMRAASLTNVSVRSGVCRGHAVVSGVNTAKHLWAVVQGDRSSCAGSTAG